MKILKCCSLLALAITANIFTFCAEAKEASEAETQYFEGKWLVQPAPVAGFENIVVAKPQKVEIKKLEGNQIERISEVKGAKVSVKFQVKSFRGNFPWWAIDSDGSMVAKKIDEETFHLASTGPMGKADWKGAKEYKREKEGE